MPKFKYNTSYNGPLYNSIISSIILYIIHMTVREHVRWWIVACQGINHGYLFLENEIIQIGRVTNHRFIDIHFKIV